jgi:hypothetical protein
MIDGIAAGLWGRRKRGRRIELDVQLARTAGKLRRAELEREAAHIGAFLGLEAVLAVDES